MDRVMENQMDDGKDEAQVGLYQGYMGCRAYGLKQL